MSNVRSINQDDVLGGDDDLSPSEFGGGRADDHMEIDDEPAPPSKKKSGIVPLVGGILAAVGIVGFFGWKILSPYLGDHGGADRDAFAPIAPAAHKPQPFAQDAPTLQGGAQAPVSVQTAGMPAAAAAPGGAIAQKAETPGAQVAVQAGSTAVSIAMPTADPAGTPAVKVTGDKIVIGAQPSQAPIVEKPAVQATPSHGASTDDIAQINKRIDGISAALASLKETVEKLQADMKSRAAPQKQVVAKPAPTVSTASKKSPAPAQVAKKPVDSSKGDGASEAKPTVELQLQAVLQDRAWFKTKGGETITVSPGEELRGVGVVKLIDADAGRVIFTNGIVYR